MKEFMKTKNRDPLSETYSNDLRGLVDRMLVLDGSKRINITEVVCLLKMLTLNQSPDHLELMFFDKFIFPNGDVYTGYMYNDEKQGFGYLEYGKSDKFYGDKYYGEWKNNRMHGKSLYTSPNRDKYDGEWKDSKKHG